MKIAVTSAFGWPYVRRGNRVVYELAAYLAGRGNEVHFITTKPGDISRIKNDGNLLIRYYPVLDNPVLTHFNVEYWQTFALTCLRALLREDYDIIFTSLTMDAIAASLNRSVKGTPFVPVLINGDPLYKDARRAKRLFRRAVETAYRLVTISNFVNGILKRDYGADGIMIPCPVDTEKFHYDGKPKSSVPRILCTAAMTMERKRVPLLVKAFELLIKQVPDAVLQLAGETTPEVTEDLLMTVNAKARQSIEVVTITSDSELSSFYRNSAITVLPSIKEPFGMVTTESLASGTPVVGTRSGGTAEILEDPDVGILFEPDGGPEDLCSALIRGIELSQDPDTPRRCSEYAARRYSWNTLGPRYEEVCRDVSTEYSPKRRLLRKIFESGNAAPSASGSVFSLNGSFDSAALRRFFINTLDELEITAQKYYEIESTMPRCVHVLEWMLSRGITKGKALMLSSHPHFMAELLRNLDFQVTHIVLNNRAGRMREDDGCERFCDPGPIGNVQGLFDVMLCDDILFRHEDSDVTFRILKKHLTPGGVLVVTAPNVDRCWKRYPFGKESEALQPARCGDYSLSDVEGMVVRAGFSVTQKDYIRGEKPIDKTNTFAHVPLKTYLLRKMYTQLEKIKEPMKSHLFVAVRHNNFGGEG